MVAAEHFVLQAHEFFEKGEPLLVRLGFGKGKPVFGVLPDASEERVVLHVVTGVVDIG